MKIGNIVVYIKRLENQPLQEFEVLVFTKTGKELLKLVDNKPDLDYVQLFASKARKYCSEIKYAYILAEDEDGTITHDGLKDVPLTEAEQKEEQEKEKNK